MGMAIRGWLLAMLACAGWSLPAHAAAPAAPTNCVAAGMSYYSGNTLFYLSWNDNSTDETLWVIQISVNNGAFQNLGTYPSGTTAATGPVGISLSDPVANTAYRFMVFASNGSQSSAAATSASATAGVFTLTASAVQCQAVIALSWPNVPNESGYQILMRCKERLLIHSRLWCPRMSLPIRSTSTPASLTRHIFLSFNLI